MLLLTDLKSGPGTRFSVVTMQVLSHTLFLMFVRNRTKALCVELTFYFVSLIFLLFSYVSWLVCMEIVVVYFLCKYCTALRTCSKEEVTLYSDLVICWLFDCEFLFPNLSQFYGGYRHCKLVLLSEMGQICGILSFDSGPHVMFPSAPFVTGVIFYSRTISNSIVWYFSNSFFLSFKHLLLCY